MNDWMAPQLFRILVVAIIFSPTVLFRLAEEGDVEASLTILLLEESIKYVIYILASHLVRRSQ